MDNERFAQITSELSELLERQMRLISGRELDELTQGERSVYEEIGRRIEALQSELRDLS
jgi:hypothetical protein